MGPLHRTTVLTALALAEPGAAETLPLALPPRCRALPGPGGLTMAKVRPDPSLLPFRRERILAVGVLAALGPIPLAFGDTLQPAILVLYLGVLGVLLAYVRAGRIPCLADRWLNLAGLAYFALIWFGIRFGGRSLLRTALHILLFTAVLKLASIKRERDFSVALDALDLPPRRLDGDVDPLDDPPLPRRLRGRRLAPPLEVGALAGPRRRAGRVAARRRRAGDPGPTRRRGVARRLPSSSPCRCSSSSRA